MPNYVFFFSTDGRQTVNFNVTNPPLEFLIPLDDTTLRARLFLYGGQSFNVEVFSERENEDPGRIGDLLTHTISGLYDSAGLSVGIPLTVAIEGFYITGTRTFAKATLALPKFEVEINAAGLGPHDWISVAVGSPQLRAALRDIRLAMQTPGEVAVHCYRAIERVRQFFSATVNDRKQSWRALGLALNVERSWLDSYTSHATAVRHGELVDLPLAERNECLRQTAIVVIRFAAYLKGGMNPLAGPNFPLLSQPAG
jgi:hypothetical protein